MTVPAKFADAGARAMTLLNPEEAHALTVKLMAKGLGPRLPERLAAPPILRTEMAGLVFPNPLGLAAGFDKNAEAMNAMLRLGFGFVEAGAVTPKPQPGNARPRVFRLRRDAAVINRYGFNNDGLEIIAARLAKPRIGVTGINLGANKDSADRVEDYVISLKRLDGFVDFYTVNISSPNTPGLRTLQDKAALTDLLQRVLAARDALTVAAPVFLKVAPDLSDEDKSDIAACVVDCSVDGLIVSNTTLARPNTLKSYFAKEAGGLSGAPLFAPSTTLLGEFYDVLRGAVPLIGVGGVASARDAYEKIRNGATLVQLYTALIYKGPGLVKSILTDLPALLKADGYAHVSEAVGAARA